MTSDPPPSGRLRALFEAADALPEAERVAFVRANTPNDAALGDAVLDLLARATAGEALDAPDWSALLATVPASDSPDSERVGERVGAYRLVRLVGRGGMGDVYEAVRDDTEFMQRVAIKLLRPGRESVQALRRFRYERQLLAALRHPHIAALLDGGVTAAGDPYFVMEFVDGVPITQWVATHALAVADRVRLLRQVCAAVSYAHARLIVHRDLKPGNILVDQSGTVRLLDFGIARLLRDADDLDALPPTEASGRALTPDYASPEQFRGEAPQPASDIYSLGVLAFEVLADVRPYALAGRPWSEQQAVLEAIAQSHRLAMVAPPERRAALRGDLEAIVSRALQHEVADRYRSVDELAADLDAWAAGYPVRARRIGRVEQVRKLVRRRPIESAVVALGVMALLGAALWSQRAARIAQREQARTAAVNAFLQDMLASADPDRGGAALSMREVVDAAARRLEASPVDADLASDLRLTLATAYYGLGEWARADTLATRAYNGLEVRGLTATARAGEVLALRGVIAEGRGALAEGDSLLQQALRTLRASQPPDPRRLADALENASRLRDANGHLADAEALIHEEIALRQVSRDSAVRRGLPLAWSSLAVMRSYQGRLAEADSLQRLALATEAAASGREWPRYAELERGLADILESRGQLAAADSLMRHALPLLARALGPTHTTYLRALAASARRQVRLGAYREALATAAPVVAAIDGPLPRTDVTAASVLQFVGAAHDSLREYAAGEAALRRAWALRRESMGRDHWATASAEATVGAHLLLVGQYREAETHLQRGYAGVVATHGAAAPYATAIARRLVLLYDQTRRPALAATWRARTDTTTSP